MPDQPVHRDAQGNYYVGPARHRDDLPLTPEDVERKAHGDDPSARLTVDDLTPPTTHQRIMELGEMVERMRGRLLLVADGRGRLVATYPGDGEPRAHAHAQALRGVVAELPIIGDYR